MVRPSKQAEPKSMTLTLLCCLVLLEGVALVVVGSAGTTSLGGRWRAVVARRMFSGLRSQWMMPASSITPRASTIWEAK